MSICLACGDADAPASATSTSSTSGATTTPEVPTTGEDPTTGTTAADSTGAAPETSSSGAETTSGGVSGCGDGVVDPGEQCDDGAEGNADTRFCTEDCTLNVCGDGKLFVGWELCDEGPANSDEYGHLCGTHCEPGARCGDHEVQPAFETCDLGLDNGGPKGDEQGILCDAGCRAQQLRGFVTAAAYTGDLGGLFGADLKCRDAAEAAGLAEPDRFHALLSTGDIDAKDRFKAVAATLPYVLVNGKKFADDFTSLIDEGPLGEGISVTETGAAAYKTNVATNTAPGGIRFSPDQHCQSWTSASALYKARFGVNAVPLDAPEWSQWQKTQAWIGVLSSRCDKPGLHLYCLEI